MQQIPIVKIDDWNFYGQTKYYPEYPIHLPAGSTIHAYATYDNTAENPFNPNDPPNWIYIARNLQMKCLNWIYNEYRTGRVMRNYTWDDCLKILIQRIR